MNALVTGAAGLLGSHLVELLRERNHTVSALIRPQDDASRLMAAGVPIRHGDLRDAASLRAAVRDADTVFHCAARTGPWGNSVDYHLDNVRGLEVLLDAAITAGVRRFVHVSSITVHGNDLRGAAGEDGPLRVEPNPYSRSKVAGEQLIEDKVRQGAPVTTVRPGWIYGPRDCASFASLARKIERGSMAFLGSGANHVPLIYVRDVAEGMLLASEAPGAAGRVYLLVNDEPVTQRAYLEAIAAELGTNPPRRHVPYRLALALGFTGEMAGHALRLRHAPPLTRYGVQLLGGENRFRIERARRELGFFPRTSMLDGVRQSIAWYRSQFCSSTTVKEYASCQP